MRVGDDVFRAGDPARALDRQPARGSDHAHHAVRGAPDLQRARDVPQRWRHVRSRARYRRQPVGTRHRLENRARRRKQRVQPAQDRRALDVRAQAPSDGRLRHHRRGDPHDPKGQGPAERGAEHPVQRADAREDHRAAQPEAQALHATREEPAQEQRPAQPERGRIRRGGALRQDQRCQARAQEGPEDKPGE